VPLLKKKKAGQFTDCCNFWLQLSKSELSFSYDATYYLFIYLINRFKEVIVQRLPRRLMPS
jgi:hypothetical protein